MKTPIEQMVDRFLSWKLTPENRAAFTAYIQYSLESARIESEREEGLDRLRKAIVKREAD